MVCRVEVIGGPGAVKNAKKIMSALDYSWKKGGEYFVEDYVPRLLKVLGYTVVEQRHGLPFLLGATTYYKLHGENLPSFQEQLIFARIWALTWFRLKSHRESFINKLDKLEDEYMA